ncbi:MAG: Crp/Fnr family transcriptional regulator [Cytophagales bacterium]|nr:Crp/Fnr family transcriptional regulator [Cytophagales bacterium]
MLQKLITGIQEVFPMNASLANEFSSFFTKSEYPKRALIVQPGMLNQKLFFLETGLLREYYVFDGEDESTNEREVTAGFSHEGQFTFTTIPFLSGEPSRRYIQTIEPTIVYTISYQSIKSFVAKHHSVSLWLNVLYEQRLIRCETRMRIGQARTAEDAYKLFRKHFGLIAGRIPDKFVASYLNISTGTLSRFRS